MQQEPVEPARLLERTKYFAKKAGASDSSIQVMLDMLQSPLGQSILQMASGPDLSSLLVNDLYKVHMQSMYAQYMTGKSVCLTSATVCSLRPVPCAGLSCSNGDTGHAAMQSWEACSGITEALHQP
jgi:hypothetical protein